MVPAEVAGEGPRAPPVSIALRCRHALAGSRGSRPFGLRSVGRDNGNHEARFAVVNELERRKPVLRQQKSYKRSLHPSSNRQLHKGP